MILYAHQNTVPSVIDTVVKGAKVMKKEEITLKNTKAEILEALRVRKK